MAKPISLPAAFDGMWQDAPRNGLPKGRAWNLVDYVPQQLGAPAVERGGWAYASPSLTAADASATYVKAGIYAPFTAGDQLLVIDDNSHLIKVVSSTSATDVGTAVAPLQNPVMHQQSVIIPSPDGSTSMGKYDGTTISSLTAGPAAKYAAVFINRVWAVGTTANPYRVYASAAGDPTSWSLTGTNASYLDVGFEAVGIAALPTVQLVFGKNRTARFRGTTPPPGTDMSIDDPIFNQGCIDARSIAVNGSQCVFANTTGLWLTNGTSIPEELTFSVGLRKYWRDLFSGYASSWTVAGGFFGSTYVVSIMDGTTFKDAFVVDIPTRRAVRLSNLKALCIFPAPSAGVELYAGLRSDARAVKLSTMWTPGSSYKNDADGTAVTAVWESPFYEPASISTARLRDVYVDYDLRDAASDNPTMTVSYITSPESTSYTALSPTLAETTVRTTVRRPVRKPVRGFALKVTRTNAASDARIYEVGATIYGREGSRLS